MNGLLLCIVLLANIQCLSLATLYPSLPPHSPFEAIHTGFEARQPGFESRIPGFESKQPGFEDRHPGFESRHPGFESPRTGFETRQKGFGSSQPGFESRQPGFNSGPLGFVPRPPVKVFEPISHGFDASGSLERFEARLPTYPAYKGINKLHIKVNIKNENHVKNMLLLLFKVSK